MIPRVERSKILDELCWRIKGVEHSFRPTIREAKIFAESASDQSPRKPSRGSFSRRDQADNRSRDISSLFVLPELSLLPEPYHFAAFFPHRCSPAIATTTSYKFSIISPIVHGINNPESRHGDPSGWERKMAK